MPREGKQNRSGKAAVLEPDELQNLLAELDDPYRAIAQLCYLTAGRIGEVLLLEAGHVTGGYLLFPAPNTKMKVSRTAKITAPMAKVLERVKPASGYLFSGSGKSGHMTARAVEHRVKRAAELLGYQGVSLHSFRRSRLTHLHEQGWSLSELMRVSGHKSLAALQEYLGVDQSAVDEKLAALDAGFEVA